ncbi:NAD-dependent epimerase/dehydratase family protein [Stutzerimonas stutzeri]|uniref:NAD-dependent epimerase/dehydratase family protein n=1 Tax=Stutzerimonas stutzeri TaxID=316 RepID=A0A6I6LNY9_STUST|nr:NAD(P)-dependent oxidoreductase [Stutzerimonas stutzeri]QGZ30973.1 NAD-dependent epimerase/dehydratase family protein [Stutzerimonas stutzeri]
MTTLITGSSGFVGLALAEHLLTRGETVIGFDRSVPTEIATRAFAALPGRFVSCIGDVRNAEALYEVMSEHRPQRLVTLAAITANEARERHAAQTIFDVNVGGVLAAISAAADHGVERVLHVSSGSVYGRSGRLPTALHEDDTPLLPEGLYGMSKRAAEEAAMRLASLRGLPLVVGRLGTCFGPWEADSGVRDTLSAPLQVLARARHGETAILPRAGRRDWLYVRDAVAAMASLLDQPHWGYPRYNLAAGFEWSVADWCACIAPRYPGFEWRLAAPGEQPDIDYFADYDRASMDIHRLVDDTTFRPRFGLTEAQADYHHWLEEHAPIGATAHHD